MTNRFANGKRRADDAFQQTLEYGAAMPSYDENATNWESRQKERMRGRRVLARFGFGKRDMSLTFIIDETFRNVRAAEKMGDQNALWAEYYKLLRAHLRRRRKSLAESREHSRNRKEVTEYGQLKQVSPSFVTRLLMGTNGKPFDVEYAKRQIDHKAAENNPPEPDKSKCYEDGFQPNIAAATALANAEAERLRQVEADNAAARALADELFPRDEKGQPVDDPKTQEIMGNLEKLVDQPTDETPDELTAPVETPSENWGPWWASMRNAAHDLDITELHAYVHKFFDDVASVKDTGKSQNDMLIEFGKHCSLVRSGKAELLIKPKTANNVSEDTPTAIGVQDMQPEAPSAPNTPEKTVSSTSLPEAPFSANFKLLHSSGVEVQFTIRAASGSEGLPQVNNSINYLLEHGYSITRATNHNAAPNGATQQPAQSSNNGKSPCMLVKVVKSYEGNKPQLEFEVDGFEKPLRFTREKSADLIKVFNGVRKPDGSEFSADDMTDGRKFGGNWLVRWEKVEKNGKTYTNVIALEPAA